MRSYDDPVVQPLRTRRDYDEGPEAAMVKPLPVVEESEEEYDVPMDAPRGRGMGLRLRSPWKEPCAPPPGRGRLLCPGCGRGYLFKMAALKEGSDISCPYCQQTVSTASLYQEGQGYKAVMAKCLDPDFKKIRDALKPGKELSDREIRMINKHLDNIYKKYRELEEG